jgi:hypothetical protein
MPMPRLCGASLISNQIATLLAGLTLFAIVAARPALKIARAAVPAPPPMQRESIGLVVVAVLTEALAKLALLWRWRLLCATSNKRRQPIDIVASVVRSLLAWALDVDLVLRLLVLLLRKRLRIARQVRLRLAHAERRIAPGLLLITIFLVKCLITRACGAVVFNAREMRVVLPELLLRRGDETVVVLRVLVVILR